MDLVYPTWIAGLLTCGMGVALLGSIKVALARKLDIDEARVGGLVSMFGFAMIPVMLIMGFLTDYLDKQIVVVLGALLVVAALIVFSQAKAYTLALIAVLMLSAGWSALVNVLNVLMQAAFGGSPTFAMNLGNFFFGLGAFLTPLVVAALLKRSGLTGALMALAVVAGIALVSSFGVDFDGLMQQATETADAPAEEMAETPAAAEVAGDAAEAEEQPAEEAAEEEPAEPAAEVQADKTLAGLLANPIMWLAALGLLFYAPMEATMAAWATTYLGDKGAPEGEAATWLSGFWLAFMGTRLATALAVANFGLATGGDTILIIGLSVLCILVWAGAVASPTKLIAGLMVVAAGAVFGPTFPTIIGVLLGNVHPELGGRAVGLFFAVGGIGWSIIPIMIGTIAQKSGVQRGFMVAVGSAVGLTVIAIILHFVVPTVS
jgi:fucose permease